MIQEDYVSFETAKLLKEKGFEGKMHTFYTEDGKEMESSYIVPSNFFPIYRPTLQMAMKWLREVHNIDIDIDAKVGILGRKVYLPTISTYRCREDSDRLMQKQFELSYKDDTAVVPALQYFNSYEEAAEAAIKYCLEKLI